MPHCEFCGTLIDYLPFKCKYCGGIYCKKHRLPENHECTFELKHTSVIPKSDYSTEQSSHSKIKISTGPKRLSRPASDFKNPKDLDKYLKKERKVREKARIPANISYSGGTYRMAGGDTSGTAFLIVSIITMSIVALFLPIYLCLSLFGLSNYYIWTFFSSLFISYTEDLFGLFFLIFLIIMVSSITRNIELQFGTRFYIKLFFICTIASLLLYLLICILLFPIFPNAFYYIPIGFAIGGIYGLIGFVIYFNPKREMILIFFFIPIKMKARSLLLFMILPYLLLGILLGILISPHYFAVYLPMMGGVMASYIIFKVKFKN